MKNSLSNRFVRYYISRNSYRLSRTGYRLSRTGYRLSRAGYRTLTTGFVDSFSVYSISFTGYRVSRIGCRISRKSYCISRISFRSLRLLSSNYIKGNLMILEIYMIQMFAELRITFNKMGNGNIICHFITTYFLRKRGKYDFSYSILKGGVW